jgi:hypothetical protein
LKAGTVLRLAAALALPALAWPAHALACACCANRGDYLLVNEPVKAFEVNELVRLRFASTANLRIPEGEGFDRGLKLKAPPYRVSQFRHGRIFVLRLKDRSGRSGSVSFALPARATKLQEDLQDGKRAAGGGPLLYREWTLRGTLEGTALVEKPRFRLVLQGRGNACMNASDFRSWILVANGPRTSFTLYGTFAAPAP